MDWRQTAHDHPIPHMNVTAQRTTVSEDNIVADHAIVGHMRIRHEHAIAADDGFSGLRRTAIERHELPNHRSVTHLQQRRLSTVLEILRRTPDSCHVMDLAFPANAASAVNHSVRSYPRTFTNGNIVLNDGKRPHSHLISNHGLGTDNCARINVSRHYCEEESF